MMSSMRDAFGTVTPGSSPTTSLVATGAKFWPSTSSPPFFDMTTTTAVTHEAQPRSSPFVTVAEGSCFGNSSLLQGLESPWHNPDSSCPDYSIWNSQNRAFDDSNHLKEITDTNGFCLPNDSSTSSTNDDNGVRPMAHTNYGNDLVTEEDSISAVNDTFSTFELNSTRNSPPIVSAPSIFPTFNNNAISTLEVGCLNGIGIPLETMGDQIPVLKQRAENLSLDEPGRKLEGECGSRNENLMVASPSTQDVNRRRRFYGAMSSPSSSEETKNWSAETPTLGSSLPCGPLAEDGLARSLSGPCVGEGFNPLTEGPPYMSRSHSSSTMPYHACLRPAGMPMKPYFLPSFSYMEGASLDLKEMERTRPKRRNVKISKDPQSVAARHRRAKISDRIRLLQRLVPGGTKMDTASMLDEAILYLKYLEEQVNYPHHQYPSSFYVPRPNPSPSPSPSPQSFGTQDVE